MPQTLMRTQHLPSSPTRNWLIGILFGISLLFALGALRMLELPGVYMDHVNPDYLAAETLNPKIDNPIWAVPTAYFPVIGAPYHGTQTLYVSTLFAKVFGFGVTTLRLGYVLFGLSALMVFMFLVRAITQNQPWLTTLVPALLATDIAFSASFRTQYYIVLSGSVWFLLSVLFLFRDRLARINTNIFFSGFFAGLAIYGYFVYVFFVPGLLLIACLLPLHKSRWHTLLIWGAGLMLGLFPYLLGFVFLVIKLGGLSDSLAWLASYTRAVHPLSSELSWLEALAHAMSKAVSALSNQGNEILIFGNALTSLGIFSMGFILMLSASSFAWLSWKCIRSSDVTLLIRLASYAALPVSYLLSASLLGARLGGHHFIPLITVSYLFFAGLLGEILRVTTSGLASRILMITVFTVLFAVNLSHHGVFYNQLQRTGGVKYFSSALNELSTLALTTRGVGYIFPEWGFFMPFAYLTGNRIPYALELTPYALKRLQQNGADTLRVVFWDFTSEKDYRKKMSDLGILQINHGSFQQRDGRLAFYYLDGILQ